MNPNHKIKLSNNWWVQSSEKTTMSGSELSVAEVDLNSWYKAVVPSTIMATLVANGVYNKPYFGKNMADIPKKQFKVPWWYVNNIELNKSQKGKTVILNLEGINYKANIWINGNLVADNGTINGAFRHLSFDITKHLKEGKNGIAIEVIPPKPGDFTIGFVDWNVWPADNNMGIFRDVTLHFCEGVSIDNIFVETEVNVENLKSAELKVSATVSNYTPKTLKGKMTCSFNSSKIEKEVELHAYGSGIVVFSPDEYDKLKIKNPELWWPNTMGDAVLQEMNLTFEVGGTISDKQNIRYGIRKVEDYINEDGHRGFKINGKKVLIKGGGWTDDLFLQDTHDSLKAQIDYVKHMNLNAIRLEGFWGKDHQLYDLCDENGILIMVGWSCQWEHENHLGKPVDIRYGGVVEPKEIDLIAKSWEEQVIWLRQHPSIFVWTVGSDLLPHPDLERRYIETFNKYDSTRPYINSTGGVGSDQGIISKTEIVSELSGSSCVKMLGPYAYTPPVYWFTNDNLGGAYGFNTETCPGANVPPLASLKRFIPQSNLWPVDDVWEYHCGTNEFSTLDRFSEAIDKRYGGAKNIKEFAFKAQVLNYELMRPMFEAFVAHQPKSTGIIQWMLNSAWPEMYWQLYDSFLQPNGAFYATRKACKMLHAIYRYGKDDIYLTNNNIQEATGLKVVARMFDISTEEICTHEWTGDIAGNHSMKILDLPAVNNIKEINFLDLRIYNRDGIEIDDNFYWLSEKEDILDYEAGKTLEWEYHTPSKQFADFSALDKLPTVELDYIIHVITEKEKMKITLDLKNPSDSIAFFLSIEINEEDTGEPVLPQFLTDNYFSLLPKEEKKIEADFFLRDLKGDSPEVMIEGWNVKRKTIR